MKRASTLAGNDQTNVAGLGASCRAAGACWRRATTTLIATILLAGALVIAASAIIDPGRKVTGVGGDGVEMKNENETFRGDEAPAGQGALLTYELVTRHPTKRGNFRLVVDEDGGIRTQRNEVDPPEGQAWAADLPVESSRTVANVQARVKSILDAGGFFDMAELQVNEAGNDGSIRILRWNGDRGARTVTVDRAHSPAFDQIIRELSKLLSVPGM